MLRLLRGNSAFLIDATDHLMALGVDTVYSPPLYRSSAAVWRASGYEERHRLNIMERSLGLPFEPTCIPMTMTVDPPWDQVVRIDKGAFEGMWRMSETGLREALESTRVGTVLLAGDRAHPDGYAMVGSQWGVCYLHRVAVDPTRRGRGIGSELVRAAIGWARRTLSTAMVLNVRPGNHEARRLYEREAFTATGTDLHLLGYGARWDDDGPSDARGNTRQIPTRGPTRP